MAVYDLEEQEQLDELKTWWKQYGNLVTGLMLVVALAAAGWQGWNWYQRNQSAQASSVYSALQQSSNQRDAKRSKELAGELIDKYSGSPYAGMGAMLSARTQLEVGDAKTAKLQLQWVAERASDEGLRDLARLRLAVVLLDEKAFDDALVQLGKAPATSFLGRYGEIKGDILAAQGKAVEAKSAYEAALKSIDDPAKKADGGEPKNAAYRDVVQAKLDRVSSMGVAK
jgi:predicted negative regulator of RcsB-dependent stress response